MAAETGDAKARAVEGFANERRVDLERSFAYANGDEDVPFLKTVGNPRALNPQEGLARTARELPAGALELFHRQGGARRSGLACQHRAG